MAAFWGRARHGMERSITAGRAKEEVTTTQAYRYHAGIDWASDHHDVCVVDDNGTMLGEKQVEHSGDGIRECINWLLQLAGGDASSIAVAIEVPHGAVVESLIENNLAVFAINPNHMDRFR